jgi:sulfide:quinone oxidoreductase
LLGDHGRVTASNRLRVLIAGAGVAGLETMLALRKLAEERVEIEVVSPQDDLSYRPLHVTEPFRADRAGSIALEPLFSRHGISFRRGVLSSLHADARTIRLAAGEELAYDALVIACGGTHTEGVTGALTFPSLGDVEDFRALLDDLAEGRVKRAAFALPAGAGWPLPLYELALLTATELERRGAHGATLTVVTPESTPLGLFGDAASTAVRALLEGRGIELLTQTYPVAVEEGGLAIRPGGLLAAERVVSLSRLEGPRIDGVPKDANGFIPVDRHGQIVGLEAVYAAGDAANFPLKQGGIAAQQAEAVAEAIAARAGAPVTPRPFRPVLRGLLLTGEAPRYLRSHLTGGYGDSSLVSLEPLWWPPAKIAGRYLGPALAGLTEMPIAEPPATEASMLEVDVELPESDKASRTMP